MGYPGLSIQLQGMRWCLHGNGAEVLAHLAHIPRQRNSTEKCYDQPPSLALIKGNFLPFPLTLPKPHPGQEHVPPALYLVVKTTARDALLHAWTPGPSLPLPRRCLCPTAGVGGGRRVMFWMPPVEFWKHTPQTHWQTWE